jgi:hypothetical protein
VVAIFGVQGWRWEWVRGVHELVFAFDADDAGQEQWRTLARQAALRGKQVEVLEPGAYGGQKDANEAWVAGTLTVGTGSPSPGVGAAMPVVSEDLQEAWDERRAIMEVDGGMSRAEAECLAWAALHTYRVMP